MSARTDEKTLGKVYNRSMTKGESHHLPTTPPSTSVHHSVWPNPLTAATAIAGEMENQFASLVANKDH